ncbi:Alpha/Beta hydrolase protein, partial [Gaertneriomyces semiglobifer]
ESASEKVIYYLHGGAYILGTAPFYRHLTGRIAMKTNTRIFAINYRKAPEHPFPAALYDAFIGYCWLTMPDHPMFMNRPYDHTPVHPSNVVLMGDSAGGGLCMALLNYLNLYLRSSTDHATPMVPLPGGAILLSPWVDLTFSSESWRSNMAADWLPDATDIHSPVSTHLPHPQTVRDAVTRFSKHPLLSPLHAPTFAKLPPLLVQSGDAEVLRDESILLAQKYDNDNTGHAGCEGSWVRHELYRDMVHVFMAFPGLRQSTVAIERWSR